MNVNIGLALVLGSSCLCAQRAASRSGCSCARSDAFHGENFHTACIPRRLSMPRRYRERVFIGFMRCMIRRERRGLCFDRVTAAGGAEFVVVSERMLSAAPPADGDRPPQPHLLITEICQSQQISINLRGRIKF